MGQLELFLHEERRDIPLLIKAGLAHVQFETIHPFSDGNGRLGRLLITFLLCAGGALNDPILYLSLFLKTHRQVYYDLLTKVRSTGDWEAWLAFFLKGVKERPLIRQSAQLGASLRCWKLTGERSRVWDDQRRRFCGFTSTPRLIRSYPSQQRQKKSAFHSRP